MCAGDAILFENRTFHTAAPNLSQRTSKVIIYGYAYRWMKTDQYLDPPDQRVLQRTTNAIDWQLLGGYRNVDEIPQALIDWAEQYGVNPPPVDLDYWKCCRHFMRRNNMTDDKSAFLFIDDACIESLDRVVQGVVPAKKVSPQPLIEKDRAWEDEWLIGSYINVTYDDDENIFKMWYGVGRKLSEARGDQADGLAYAVSQDGIHWEKTRPQPLRGRRQQRE